jgi:hypothetical protein
MLDGSEQELKYFIKRTLQVPSITNFNDKQTVVLKGLGYFNIYKHKQNPILLVSDVSCVPSPAPSGKLFYVHSFFVIIYPV